MKTFQITLSQSHLNCLAVFLGRTTLKGSESESFNSLIAAIRSAKEIQPEPKKSTDSKQTVAEKI